MTLDPEMFLCLMYIRAWWAARNQCPDCRPSIPCSRALRQMLDTEAFSIALDLAVAEQIAGRTPTWVIPTWMVTADEVAYA